MIEDTFSIPDISNLGLRTPASNKRGRSITGASPVHVVDKMRKSTPKEVCNVSSGSSVGTVRGLDLDSTSGTDGSDRSGNTGTEAMSATPGASSDWSGIPSLSERVGDLSTKLRSRTLLLRMMVYENRATEVCSSSKVFV